MIFFERHLSNINSLVLSNIFFSVDHFSGVIFCQGFKFCVDFCINSEEKLTTEYLNLKNIHLKSKSAIK